ncbi:alpha/beta hydrolase [Candidatus Sumerlaeota bacterium]|nr:alpha/beta hydrolase [Candidatus Sumerlaeota bacterium]
MFLPVLLALNVSIVRAGQPQGVMAYPPTLPDARVEVYKTIGDVKLNIYIFDPADHKATDKSPAIVFFFGGGWRTGSPGQFQHHCRYLASRGMVAMTADYRVASRQNARVVDCVRDAKSAIRYVRADAQRLGVDPDRIAAGGGSAGGHIAGCAGAIDGLDEQGEDQKVSSKPNALVLFNPAIALAPFEGMPSVGEEVVQGLKERMGAEPKSLSPAHQVKRGVPPTIMFFGTNDRLLSGAQFFQKNMKEAGNRCELLTYEGQAHGFFNFGRGDNKFFRDTVEQMDKFLASLGYISGEPTIDKHMATLGQK